MDPNILVVGSVNMDVVTPIQRLPLPGETLHAGEVAGRYREARSLLDMLQKTEYDA